MVQNRILNHRFSTDLVRERLLTPRLIIIPLGYNLILVNITSLFWNTLALQDFHANNVLFVELFGPSLWDSILHLILNHDFVRALCEGLSQ